MQRAIRVGVTILVGATAGFLLAGPVVFADGPMGERFATLGVAAVVYLVLGACFGWWLRSWAAGLWLAAPGSAVALALGEEWAIIGLTLAVLVIAGASGGWVGAHWLRAKR